MIKGETSTGFKYEFPKENLNNYELIEALNETEINPLKLTKTVDLLLGIEQRERLKDHVRTESGIVPSDEISNTIMEIFQNQKEVKNS